MQTLAELIREHAAAEATAGDWQAVAAKLSEATTVIRDSTPMTYAKLGSDLGDNVRKLVAGTLRQVAASQNPLAGEVSDAHVVLLNDQVGLDISSDTRQDTIDLLAAAGQWSDNVRDAIKAAGKRLTSLAGGTVTADECKTAWTADALQSQWTALQNEGVNAAISSGDKVALKTLLTSFVGSL